MDHFKNLLTAILLGGLINACSPVTSEKIQDDVSASVKENQKAKTITEWENSDYNNEKIFQKWRESNASSEAVCVALQAMPVKDLSLFEEDIKASENLKLVESCKDVLVLKLETYWAEQKKSLGQLSEDVIIQKSEEAKNESTEKLNQTQETKPLPKNNNTQPLQYNLKVKKANFQFPDLVQTRDVSKGYMAYSADLGRKEVILTFDDGPHPIYTERILAALKSVNAKVIFFALGKNSKAFPNILRKSALDGHSIGSHSVTHKCLAANSACRLNNDGKSLSYEEALAEIKGGHQAVYNAIGWVDPFFRFPYGEFSADLQNYLKTKSVAQFQWNIDSSDWKNMTLKQLISNTLAQVENKGRGVILFHDIQRKTAEALPEFLRQLYYKGYSVVVLKSQNPNDRKNSKLVK